MIRVLKRKRSRFHHGFTAPLRTDEYRGLQIRQLRRAENSELLCFWRVFFLNTPLYNIQRDFLKTELGSVRHTHIRSQNSSLLLVRLSFFCSPTSPGSSSSLPVQKASMKNIFVAEALEWLWQGTGLLPSPRSAL